MLGGNTDKWCYANVKGELEVYDITEAKLPDTATTAPSGYVEGTVLLIYPMISSDNGDKYMRYRSVDNENGELNDQYALIQRHGQAPAVHDFRTYP